MEMQKLVNVRKFIRETLNLSDSAQIIDFGISTDGGVLRVIASIKQEIDISSLAAIAPSVTKPVANQKTKYVASPKKDKSENSGMYSYKREFSINKDDFKAIRVILTGWRKNGILTTPELEEISEFAGKFFAIMSDDEKQRYLSLFNRIKEDVAKGNRISNQNKET